MSAPEVNQILAYIDPATGRLSNEGLRLFAKQLAEIKALRAIADDHEARITVLEP